MCTGFKFSMCILCECDNCILPPTKDESKSTSVLVNIFLHIFTFTCDYFRCSVVAHVVQNIFVRSSGFVGRFVLLEIRTFNSRAMTFVRVRAGISFCAQ